MVVSVWGVNKCHLQRETSKWLPPNSMQHWCRFSQWTHEGRAVPEMEEKVLRESAATGLQ